MDIRLFSLQKLEKECENLINNEELADFKKELQNSKKEIQKNINNYKNMKKQQEIIITDTKKMEKENNHFLDEIKTKEETLYSSTEAGFKELESIKENIEERKTAYQEKEEELLELIILAEEMKKEADLEKEFVNEKKIEFNKKVKEYKQLEEKNLIKVKEKEQEVKEMIKEIPSVDYGKYKAMQKKYPFTGIAIIEEGNKCSYCRLNVSVVKLREVERNDITYCESCSRLLAGKIEEIK